MLIPRMVAALELYSQNLVGFQNEFRVLQSLHRALGEVEVAKTKTIIMIPRLVVPKPIAGGPLTISPPHKIGCPIHDIGSS